MDLALKNLQRLICHKTQTKKQKMFFFNFTFFFVYNHLFARSQITSIIPIKDK